MKMISNDTLKINEILNSDSKMVRNFFIGGLKDIRVKVAKKRAEQFIVVYFIVERKKGFFWNKLYMESFVLLPDPLRELKIVKLEEYEKISYEEYFPNKVSSIKIEDLDIAELIYTVYNNYIERLEVFNNINKYADTINEWDKLINEQIKGITETEIEIED